MLYVIYVIFFFSGVLAYPRDLTSVLLLLQRVFRSVLGGFAQVITYIVYDSVGKRVRRRAGVRE